MVEAAVVSIYEPVDEGVVARSEAAVAEAARLQERRRGLGPGEVAAGEDPPRRRASSSGPHPRATSRQGAGRRHAGAPLLAALLRRRRHRHHARRPRQHPAPGPLPQRPPRPDPLRRLHSSPSLPRSGSRRPLRFDGLVRREICRGGEGDWWWVGGGGVLRRSGGHKRRRRGATRGIRAVRSPRQNLCDASDLMRTGPSFVASNPRFREAFLGSPPRAAPAVNSAATYQILLYREAFLRYVHAKLDKNL